MSYGGLGILATHFGENLLADQLRKQGPRQPEKVEDELDVEVCPCFLQARHADGELRVDASGWGRQPIKRVEGGSQDCLRGINFEHFYNSCKKENEKRSRMLATKRARCTCARAGTFEQANCVHHEPKALLLYQPTLRKTKPYAVPILNSGPLKLAAARATQHHRRRPGETNGV